MNLFRAVFGHRAEGFEDKGDDLKLHGFWREAAWFYGRALENAPEKDDRNRKRLHGKLGEARRAAFRRLLEEAEGHAELGRKSEAIDLLKEAEPFALDPEDHGVLVARFGALNGAPGEPAAPPDVETSTGPDGSLTTPPTTMELLEREVVTRPESASAHERLARALEQEGRFKEAIRNYEAAYHRNREKVSLVLEVARVCRDGLGDAIAARTRLDEGCRRHRPSPATFLLHLERAFHLADEGRNEEAIAGLGELLNVPALDHGIILFNRAGLLDRAGRSEEARADLVRALELAPSHLLYLERLADLIFKTSDEPDSALPYLDRALATDAHDFAVRGRVPGTSPDRARLQFKAARILYLLDQPDEALARVNDGLVVCWDPEVEEALLDLRRELGG